MSKFFDSEIIQEELEKINELQKLLYGNFLVWNALNK